MLPTKLVRRGATACLAALSIGACTQLIPKFVPTVKAEANISSAYPYESRFVTVEGSRIHYIETGAAAGGTPVVFVHGNPTSSYLWRNVLPVVGKDHRAIAVDLVGMGRSDKPDIPYSVEDFIRYFDGFMAQMNLKEVILVVHDWGGPIGIDYAMRHQDQVKGLAMMETIVAPMHWDQVDIFTRYLFKQLRDPQTGEELNVQQNYFVEKLIPAFSGRDLSEAEMAAYRAPFQKPSDRKLIALFPQQIPFDGEPARVHRRVAENFEKLKATKIPLLLLYAEPGAIVQGKYLEDLRTNLPAMKTVDIGPGLHFIQESQPTAIGQAIDQWSAHL